MQRFLVLCLATIFLIFEPISSTNSYSSSLPTTTTAPTSKVNKTTTLAPNTTVNKTTTLAPNTTVLTTTAPNTTASKTSITATATATATPTSTPTKSISVVATFDITFNEEYTNTSSTAYINLKKNLIKVLNKAFQEMEGYNRVEILSFRNGSVICDFKVIFKTTANPSAGKVKQTLQTASDGGELGKYKVTNIEVVVPATTVTPSSSVAVLVSSTPAPTTIPAPTIPTTSSSDKIWDKVIFDYLGGTLISFIVMVAAVGLCLILFIALICTCVRYRKLKKKTQFPKDVIINNDSNWINSHDNLLMWERNLRATEVNPAANGAQSRPTNEKRP